MLLDLLILAAVIGFLVWVICLLPIGEPFKQIVKIVGVCIVVFALLRDLLGIDILGHLRNLRS